MKQCFTDFDQWTEATKGLYRNVFCVSACYEILLTKWDVDTDVLTAKGNLYVTGEWSTDVKGQWEFTRELLLKNATISECMAAAQKDYDENVT